jgi:hypothetical protein
MLDTLYLDPCRLRHNPYHNDTDLLKPWSPFVHLPRPGSPHVGYDRCFLECLLATSSVTGGQFSLVIIMLILSFGLVLLIGIMIGMMSSENVWRCLLSLSWKLDSFFLLFERPSDDGFRVAACFENWSKYACGVQGTFIYWHYALIGSLNWERAWIVL